MTPRQIAEWGIKGDFSRGESETLGIAKITRWIEEAITAAEEAARNAAVEEERATCAKIADNAGRKFHHKDMREAAESIAGEIRARSEK